MAAAWGRGGLEKEAPDQQESPPRLSLGNFSAAFADPARIARVIPRVHLRAARTRKEGKPPQPPGERGGGTLG